MPISFVCATCGQRLRARETLVGRQIPCPKCGDKLLVPQPEEPADTYRLQDNEPAESPDSRYSEDIADKPEPEPPASSASKPGAILPPLTADETPLWLRHLHWLLVLALVPLIISLLHRSPGRERIARTLEDLDEERTSGSQALVHTNIRIFAGRHLGGLCFRYTTNQHQTVCSPSGRSLFTPPFRPQFGCDPPLVSAWTFRQESDESGMKEKAQAPAEDGPRKPQLVRRSDQIDDDEQRIHNHKSRQMNVKPDPGTSPFGSLGNLIFFIHYCFLSVMDRVVNNPRHQALKCAEPIK